MKALVTSLWHETRGQFERLPVWLPGTPMGLGDVGELGDGGWIRQTTLAELGVSVRTRRSTEPVDYDYSSSHGAEVSTTVAAGTDPALAGVVSGNAALRVRFTRPGAFVLRAASVRIHRIVNLAEVEERILEMFDAGRWRREWVLVSEVARGGPTLTLVSNGTDGEAVVDLGVTGAAGVPLAQARAGLRISRERGLAAKFVGAGESAVLWRGRRVRDPWFGVPRVADRGDQEDVQQTEDRGRLNRYMLDIEHPEDLAD
ncbi:hypothetical protein [Plantactinospora sp. GCM10030261]|uniref:hypothetical protein n=1 Tax=Plantactinospora sp. GCM10030261 TaxID=3273420 RepID=UPI003608238B